MLQEAGVGCYVGGRYAGALSYADDLVLLCPSLYGLNEMLNLCSSFASKYCRLIKFISNKV